MLIFGFSSLNNISEPRVRSGRYFLPFAFSYISPFPFSFSCSLSIHPIFMRIIFLVLFLLYFLLYSSFLSHLFSLYYHSSLALSSTSFISPFPSLYHTISDFLFIFSSLPVFFLGIPKSFSFISSRFSFSSFPSHFPMSTHFLSSCLILLSTFFFLALSCSLPSFHNFSLLSLLFIYLLFPSLLISLSHPTFTASFSPSFSHIHFLPFSLSPCVHISFFSIISLHVPLYSLSRFPSHFHICELSSESFSFSTLGYFVTESS